MRIGKGKVEEKAKGKQGRTERRKKERSTDEKILKRDRKEF